MICLECGIETEGTVNNRKERRCTACYAVLQAADEAPAEVVIEVELDDPPVADEAPPPPRRGKKASK